MVEPFVWLVSLCGELRAMGRKAEPVAGDVGTADGVAAIRATMERTLGMPAILGANGAG